MTQLMKKHCPKCKLTKPVEDFPKDKSRKGGLYTYCKSCNVANVKHNVSKNPERKKKYDADYYRSNTKRIIARAGEWAKNNSVRRLVIARRWENSHREYSRAKTNNRRARIRWNGGAIKEREWLALCEHYGNKCLCCGTADMKLELDHIVPVSKGGKHVINNAQPLCRTCNARKGDKTIDYRRMENGVQS